jgi:hypothetical protein
MAILVAAFGALAYLGTVGMITPGPGEHDPGTTQVSHAPDSSFGKYSRRAQTVFEDIPGRINDIGLQPIGWAVDQFGWMGAGLGVGSQGTASFGVNTSGAAEGGLGKLAVELGLPGVALVGWLLIAFALYVWRLLGPLASTSPKLANMAFGLVAFLLANMAAFFVATQAYADIFILLSLGWAVGFLLALPVLAKNEKEQMQRALQETESDANAPSGVLGGGPSAAYRQKFIRDRELPRR